MKPIIVLICLLILPLAYAEPLMESTSQISVAVPGEITPVTTHMPTSSGGGGGGGGINCNSKLWNDSTYCKDYCERFRKQYDCSKESYSSYTCCKGYVAPKEEITPSEPEEPTVVEEETPPESEIPTIVNEPYGYNAKIFNPAVLAAVLAFFGITICIIIAMIVKRGKEYKNLIEKKKQALQKWKEGYAEYQEAEKKINKMGKKDGHN